MSGSIFTREDIWDRIEDQHVCIFAERDDEAIRARPMAPMVRREEGRIWFVTDRLSRKMEDLGDDTPVTLVFQNGAANTYVSLIGSISIVDDRDRVKALWSPMMKEWFDGPEDPRIILLAFEPHEADYWDGPNRILANLKMAITAATGLKTGMGDAGNVKM